MRHESNKRMNFHRPVITFIPSRNFSFTIQHVQEAVCGDKMVLTHDIFHTFISQKWRVWLHEFESWYAAQTHDNVQSEECLQFMHFKFRRPNTFLHYLRKTSQGFFWVLVSIPQNGIEDFVVKKQVEEIKRFGSCHIESLRQNWTWLPAKCWNPKINVLVFNPCWIRNLNVIIIVIIRDAKSILIHGWNWRHFNVTSIRIWIIIML